MSRGAQKVLPRPRPGAPPIPDIPRPERFELSNGLRVAVVRRPDLPQAFARLILPAGSAADPEGGAGLAALVGTALLEGTRSRTPMQLHERIDGLGASLHSRVGHDFAEIDVSLLSETLEEGLQLLAEVASRPAFPDEEVERVRAETLDALDARLDEPANVADDLAGERVFGNHPYGRLPIGDPGAVEAATRDQLVAFHAERYRPAGSVLVLAGDLGGADIHSALERIFDGWTGAVTPIAYPSLPSRAGFGRQVDAIERAEAAQAEIRVAGIGMPRNSEDWVAASVVNYVLGGSTITGRLGANLREDKGWTYGVRCGFSAGVQAGGWSVETAVDGAVAVEALAEIDRELERITTTEIDPAELHRAREALILSLPRAFETPGRIVARIGTVEAYGLALDYWDRFPERVNAVDEGAALEIARRYFSPDALVRVSVGPALRAIAG